VGMRDEEGLPIHLKKGSIQAEGDGGEEAAPHEDLDEIPHVAAKGETNTPPRGAAEPVATAAHEGDGQEDEDERASQHSRRGLDGVGHLEDVADEVQSQDGKAEDEGGLEGAQEQLRPRAVIGEAIAFDRGLAEHVVADPSLGPEVVDADGHQSQEHVDDVDTEKGAGVAMEAWSPA